MISLALKVLSHIRNEAQVRRAAMELDSTLVQYGVTHAQAAMLLLIQADTRTVSQVAEAAQMTTEAARATMRRIQQRGFITPGGRYPGKGGATWYELTERGRVAVERITLAQSNEARPC